MAKVDEELTITVNAKLSVDKSTAEYCLKMVEIFLNANSDYNILADKREDGKISLALLKAGGGADHGKVD